MGEQEPPDSGPQAPGQRQALTVFTRHEEGEDRTVFKLETLEDPELLLFSVPTKRLTQGQIHSPVDKGIKIEDIAEGIVGTNREKETHGSEDSEFSAVEEESRDTSPCSFNHHDDTDFDPEVTQQRREKWREECRNNREVADEEAKYYQRHSAQFTKELKRLTLLWDQSEETPESKQLSNTLWKYGALKEFGEISRGSQHRSFGGGTFRQILRVLLVEASRERMLRVRVRENAEEAAVELGKDIVETVKDFKPSEKGGIWGFLAELDYFSFMEH